jgi:two-component system LytT family response regulator
MSSSAVPIRVLVVDDEPLARERVVHFLETKPEFQLVGLAGDGDSALKQLFECQPDVLLLDIEMPGQNAFELLALIPSEQRPICIFITAFPQHAVKAFEIKALDYVLKPFRHKRLAEALERAKVVLQERVSRKSNQEEVPDEKDNTSVSINFYGTHLKLAAKDMHWLVADGNYVKIQAQGRTYFKRVSLSQMLAQLEPLGFIRVHRSIVVNKTSVQQKRYLGNNAYQLEMKDGMTFRTGRAYKEAVQDLVEL